MNKLFAAAALATSLLAGCSNVCDRASSFDINTKKGDCDWTGITFKKVNKTDCDAKLKSCSSDDEKKLNEEEDCIEALPACQKGKETDFFTSITNCAAKANGVSDACKQALSTQ